MKKLHTLYNHAAVYAHALINRMHKATSAMRLKDIILFSSVPDFGDSTVEIFYCLYKSEALQNYKFIWFVDKKFKALKKGGYIPPHPTTVSKDAKTGITIGKNVIFKRKIYNPIFRLWYLPLESRAKLTIYTHQALGNMYNEKQIRCLINHGSMSLKESIAIVEKGTIKLQTIKEHIKANVTRIRDCSTYTFWAIRKNPSEGEIAMGLPRNDRLFDDTTEIRKRLGMECYDKIVIWMPTFKHYKFKDKLRVPRNDFHVERHYDISLQTEPEFYEKTEQLLAENNMLLIIKYHPGQDLNYVSLRETKNIKILDDTGGKVKAINKRECSSVPSYSLLGATDALITDYSSVYGDYLLTDKLIAFDITDINDFYTEDQITLVLSKMPGEKINNFDEFLSFLKNVATGKDNYSDIRKRFRNGIHQYQDANSAKRISDFLLERINI